MKVTQQVFISFSFTQQNSEKESKALKVNKEKKGLTVSVKMLKCLKI